MSEINKGPTSYHHILKRRRVSLERWADSVGVVTKEQFASVRRELENSGYFLDEEMLQFGASLPESMPVPPVLEDEKPAEVETPEEPVEVEEPKPKARKTKASSAT